MFCGFLCTARCQIEVGETGLALCRIALHNLNKPVADSPTLSSPAYRLDWG